MADLVKQYYILYTILEITTSCNIKATEVRKIFFLNIEAIQYTILCISQDTISV